MDCVYVQGMVQYPAPVGTVHRKQVLTLPHSTPLILSTLGGIAVNPGYYCQSGYYSQHWVLLLSTPLSTLTVPSLKHQSQGNPQQEVESDAVIDIATSVLARVRMSMQIQDPEQLTSSYMC